MEVEENIKLKNPPENKNTYTYTANNNTKQIPNNNQLMKILGINTISLPPIQIQWNNKLKRRVQEENKTSSSYSNINPNIINKKTKQKILRNARIQYIQRQNNWTVHSSDDDKNETQDLGNLHPLQIGKKIAPLAIQLQKINKLGKYKIQLTFNNYIHANEFVDKAKKKLSEWYTCIPDYKIYRRIVVYDILKEMNIEEIRKDIEEHESNPEVLEIERLMRYDQENGRQISTNAIKIIIKGDTLPQNNHMVCKM